MEMLIYLAKVNLYWVLLYACYRIMLQRHTFFQWNRFYLLGSLVAAFALPLIIYPADAPAIPALYAIDADAFSTVYQKESHSAGFTWKHAAALAYLAGLTFSLYRLVIQIGQLRRVLALGEKIELDDCTIILSRSGGSFSFLKTVVISDQDYEHHFDEILRHEMVHARQWHSADIILIQILQTVFWFNPVLRLYRNSMQEVHEFLADQQASNREHYAKFLISYALAGTATPFTNPFYKSSQIKTRIQMIYKNRTSKWMLGTYFAAALLAGTAALIVAGCEQQEAAGAQNAQSPAEKPDNQAVYTEVDQLPEFPGGQEAMFRFLGENIRYPEKAVEKNAEGTVMLSFLVSNEGETKDVKVLKSVGYGCDAEAVRVLSKFPKWTPGKKDGQPVTVKYTLPINFKLQGKPSPVSVRVDAGKGPAPLYVLDGVKLSAKDVDRYKSIDPDNISSVQVLKGKQATDQFGDAGDHGVVMITTKQSK